MADIMQTFSTDFLEKNVYIQIHWIFSKGLLTALIQVMAWCLTGANPVPEPMLT